MDLSVLYNYLHGTFFVGGTISGWLPVYDTMHGIRGEVNIVVKLELFEDFNRFRQSSCGVQFFSSTAFEINIVVIILICKRFLLKISSFYTIELTIFY